jgi:hypothetical protein
MKFEMFERVVLNRDLPEHGLCAGDVGTVVELYEPDGIEVEFMSAAGDTKAVLTLEAGDIRKASADEMLAVRPLHPASRDA